MDWVRPHKSRIDEFCSTLKTKNSYLHIPKSYCTCSEKSCTLKTKSNQTGFSEKNHTDYEHFKNYHTKILPVSVIVSERSGTMSGSDVISTTPYSAMICSPPTPSLAKHFTFSKNSPSSPSVYSQSSECRFLFSKNTLELSSLHLPKSTVYSSLSKGESIFPTVHSLISTASSTLSTIPSPSSSTSGDCKSVSGDSLDENNTTASKKPNYIYKPQPMSRKSKRQFISNEMKDENYWERRKRNNEAAKKSREQRREKEIEVNKKCMELEHQNSTLRNTILNLQEENVELVKTMNIYKEILMKNKLM